jgi:hypothetical protein
MVGLTSGLHHEIVFVPIHQENTSWHVNITECLRTVLHKNDLAGPKTSVG